MLGNPNLEALGLFYITAAKICLSLNHPHSPASETEPAVSAQAHAVKITVSTLQAGKQDTEPILHLQFISFRDLEHLALSMEDM